MCVCEYSLNTDILLPNLFGNLWIRQVSRADFLTGFQITQFITMSGIQHLFIIRTSNEVAKV